MNNTRRIYVRTEDVKARERLISFLEGEGFRCDADRQAVVELRFPVVVDMTDKVYSVIHTVTSAAAAVSSDAVISEDRFYEEYNNRKNTLSQG
ncbi:MAG: hypothetical protein IKN80_02580 [Clostridiales bacterium]|nr:hypothetical protein [Clostridiales bacterium]